MAVVATAGVSLLTAGIATSANATPRVHHHAIHTTHATSTPVASFKAVITVGKSSDKLSLTGPKSLSEGVVKMSLHSKAGESDLGVISFKGSYTMKKFKADLTAFGESEGQNGPTATGLKHLRNAIKHAVAYGGLDASPGEPDSGEFLLNRTGTVYVYDDTNELPADIHKVTVKKSSVKSKLPSTTKKVTLLTAKRFGGAKVLPKKGTITVTNKSTESPHFLALQHVKEGTTRKQVLDFFNSNSESAPPFALDGSTGTDTLTTGESQTLTYSLPKGEYVELCFFPDPMTGMPHALMGMIGIVHLQ